MDWVKLVVLLMLVATDQILVKVFSKPIKAYSQKMRRTSYKCQLHQLCLTK